MQLKRYSVLPGFGLSLGYTVVYLSLIVLLPLSALVVKTAHLTWHQFVSEVFDPFAIAAYRISFGTSFVAAIINAGIGLLVAWVLVRYHFFGKRVIDAMVDLPFALPTAVAGITLASLYSSNGWIGRFLTPLGIKVTEAPLGIVVAMTFIGLPFVVRTVQPVLQDLEAEVEEAAGSLGAGRWRIFRCIILPEIWPALLTGFSLAFARALGEYGSVIFIAGNRPMHTEIAPLLIVKKLDQYQYSAAAAIAVVMLFTSFAMLLLISLVQRWTAGRGVRR